MTFAVLRLGWRKRTDGFDGCHTMARILNAVPVADIAIEDIPIEEVMGQLFQRPAPPKPMAEAAK